MIDLKKISRLVLTLVLFTGMIMLVACRSDNDVPNSGDTAGTGTPATSGAEQSKEPAVADSYSLRNKSDMDAKRGVYYEIFVRAFADSDGDGIGDFNGVTAKLDYLADLGVEGIWLMPINASPSYHGYDVTDYYTVNPEYGTEEDFKNMLKEAHNRGIKVIIDFVINHTSDSHPWFESAKDENSEYRDYYTWVSEDDEAYNPSDISPWDSNVWHSHGDRYYYALFWSGMPDLNYENENVRKEIKQAAKKWLEMGVDGFRLDAAMHIYGDNEHKGLNQLSKNLEWWNEFAIACEEVNPNVYLVGEAWQNSEALAEYAQPFDTKFNFGFEEILMQSIVIETTNYNGKNLSEYLQEVLDAHYTADKNYIDGVFGTNHDQNRIISQVNNVDKAKLVANIYLTLDGNPYIYYGEELGMHGAKPDETIRLPFLWSSDKSDMDTSWYDNSLNINTAPLSEQQKDKNSMYNYYKELIALRKASTALSSGEYNSVTLDLEGDAAMAYSRTSKDETVYVIHNFSNESLETEFPDADGGEVIFSSNDTTKLEGNKVTLDGYSSIMIKK